MKKTISIFAFTTFILVSLSGPKAFALPHEFGCNAAKLATECQGNDLSPHMKQAVHDSLYDYFTGAKIPFGKPGHQHLRRISHACKEPVDANYQFAGCLGQDIGMLVEFWPEALGSELRKYPEIQCSLTGVAVLEAIGANSTASQGTWWYAMTVSELEERLIKAGAREHCGGPELE